MTNAMDCWVVQLGVVTAEHDAVARSPSLRTDRAGNAIVSRNPNLAYHEISPFVIDMENEGQLSQRGRFRTNPDDLRALIDHHLLHAAEQWNIAKTAHIDVAIYAHGGLTNEDAAAETARVWIPHLYSNRIFPIFLMWETGAFETLGNIFEDTVKGETEKIRGGFKDEFKEWWNERLEGLARPPGRLLWSEMKDNASDVSRARNAGVVQLFDHLRKPATKSKLPKIRLHLIGHSAGSIVHAHLGAEAIRQGFDVASISLLAAAVRLDEFDRQLGAADCEEADSGTAGQSQRRGRTRRRQLQTVRAFAALPGLALVRGPQGNADPRHGEASDPGAAHPCLGRAGAAAALPRLQLAPG